MPRTLLVILPGLLPGLPEYADHAIQGKATMPATLLLDLLVKAASGQSSVIADGPLVMRDAVFPHFLLAEKIEQCTFEIALQEAATEAGTTRASLNSRITLAGGISRTRTHAAVTFGGQAKADPLPEIAADFEVSAARAYRELIPFGPRYRNLHGAIRLGRHGGAAWVRSPEPAFKDPSQAGCPYLFDGALHLACLWGQRYAGVVTYPTGFSSRSMAAPMAHGQRYCVVTPKEITPQKLIFDLWLADENHSVCDTITGLAMAPLASGPMPPDWIVHQTAGSHTS